MQQNDQMLLLQQAKMQQKLEPPQPVEFSCRAPLNHSSASNLTQPITELATAATLKLTEVNELCELKQMQPPISNGSNRETLALLKAFVLCFPQRGSRRS